MTAIADAELQRLFSQYQKQVYDLGMAMISQTSGDVTRDMANHWAGEAHDAFIDALNARLEAAERLAKAVEEVDELAPNEYLEHFVGLYRQSKERAP